MSIEGVCMYMYTCVFHFMCVCIMEYYVAIRKDEILLFVATQMVLECIMLSEIKQRQIHY